MVNIGRFTACAIGECVCAVVALAVALPTRGWLTGDYYSPVLGTLDVHIGLFKTAVGSLDFDTSDINPNILEHDFLLATKVLEGLGGGLILISLICLFWIVIPNHKSVVAVLGFTLSSLLSGILLIVGPSVFNASDYTIYLDIDYSWYFALASGILMLMGMSSMGYAARAGELEPSNPNVVQLK